jgi:ribonuclease BN (tRNA processing enzyme)
VDKSKIKGIKEISNASPEELGTVAREAKVRMLVTTHMLADTVPWEIKEIVSKEFDGPIVIGEDLMTC